jgi:hypothetical protein
MLTYPICTTGNSIILAENLTDLSSPAAFADKAMQGLSAKQVLPPLLRLLLLHPHCSAARFAAQCQRPEQHRLSHDDRHSAQVILLILNSFSLSISVSFD